MITAAIRNSTGDAIQVGATPSDAITGVQIKNLSLKDNAGLGIDLGNDGTTANDVNDPDVGVNRLQNFPVLTSAAQTAAGNQVHVLGSFNVDEIGMIEYDLELYGTYATDPEAWVSLGVIQFASPTSNTVNFDQTVALPAQSPPLTAITATLTKINNSASLHETSEISAAVAIAPADLELTKSGPASAVAGRSVTWTLTVKNLSTEFAATGVTVTDTLPAGVSGVTVTPPGPEWTCSLLASTVTCTAASLVANYNNAISITANAPVSGASMTNSASLTASAGNNVTTNDAGSVTTTLLYSDVTVAKTASAPTVTRGGSLSYNITVTNASIDAGADGVQVVDTLPAGFTFVSASGAWLCSPAGSTVTCVRTGGELPISTSSILTLAVTASSTAGTYTNTATVSATNETNTANNTASVNVTVVNTAPVGTADTYPATEDQTLIVAAPGVLSNDSDADGDPMTVTVMTGPANGILSLASNGSFTYTPNANFNGSDSFTYEISDGTDVSSPVNVTLNVAAVNDTPVAVNDTATTSEDTPVTIPVLSNDSDVDGTTPSVSGSTPGTSGTVSCSATDCTYTPNLNFNGTDSFTYTITDGSATATATVSITVTAVNDPPVAVNDTASTAEDTAVTIPVLSNDSDPEGTTLSIVGNTAAGNGVVSCGVTDCTYTPNANFNGTDSFTYSAGDGSFSTMATVTITVTPVNDAPTAGADSATTTADTPVGINVLSNDSDIDGNPLSVTAWTSGSLGTVTCTAAGSCTYTPNGTSGTDTFTYTVSDGVGGLAIGTVTVTVQPVPCPTTVVALSPSSGAQAGQSGTLSWSGGTGATSFKVYLGPAGSGCSTLFGTTTGTSMGFSGLAPGEYDWKVVAESSGCTTPPASACVRFTVIDPCPNSAPSLVAPGAGAEVTPEVRFEWTTVADALRYHVVIFSATGGLEEIAVIPQPAAPLPATVSTTATIPLGNYSWSVLADFDGGCPSLSSTNRLLTVVRDCPDGIPEPIAPWRRAPSTRLRFCSGGRR